MRKDIYEVAADIDEMNDRAYALRAIAREARAHGNKARVVGMPTGDGMHTPDHVLVVSPDGEVKIFKSATALAEWLGY